MKLSPAYALRALARNLGAGLRLALMLPVARLALRIDVVQLLLLFVVTTLIDVIGDRLRFGAGAPFLPQAAGKELAGLALLLLTAVVVALVLRRAGLALALAVTVLAAWPIVEIAQYAELLAADRLAQMPGVLSALGVAIIAWIVVILVRAVALHVAAPRWRRIALALGGGAIMALPLLLAPAFIDDVAWFRGDDGANAAGALSPASEPVLAAQAQLLDDALGDLEDRDAGAPNLYFVAYAPDGNEPAWTAHMQRAQKIVDERLDTRGRSIVLRNHPDTMLDLPFATVTNLRETFAEIAAAADPDEDILMLYIGAAGARGGRIDGSLPPLDLAALTPAGLKSLLDDAGFEWRIVIVAACYAGAYLDALGDARTVVVAASAADGPGFGCAGRGEPTLFGDALFGEGFARGDSLPAAFEIARARVAAREHARALSPSQPTMRVGAEIASRIRHLRRFGGDGTVTAGAAPALANALLRIPVTRAMQRRPHPASQVLQ
jgi:Peptidase C13 family